LRLDQCYSYLKYPSLEHKVEKKQEPAKSGILGMFGGFFGGGKK